MMVNRPTSASTTFREVLSLPQEAPMPVLVNGSPIRLGDMVSGGGSVTSSSAPDHLIMGRPLVLQGDLATCSTHAGVQSFVEGCLGRKHHGKGWVLQGHKLSCGCTAISSAHFIKVQDTVPAGRMPAGGMAHAPNDPQRSAVGNRIVANLRGKWASDAERRMEEKGAYWRDKVENQMLGRNSDGSAVSSVSEVARHNVDRLATIRASLTAQESDFRARLLERPFYAVHATNGQVVNDKGDLILFSRKRLQEMTNVPFARSNSSSMDINSLGNDDYVFFSLEVGEEPRKASSRFGRTFYRVPYSHGAFTASSLLLLDQAIVEVPTSRISSIDREANERLSQRGGYSKASLMFSGRTASLEGLVDSIITVLRARLDDLSRSRVYDTRSDAAFDEIVNGVFRPEIRVPRMVGIVAGDFTTYS
jgi:uncharacterized Zn-binding protein involved in type VI secretion